MSSLSVSENIIYTIYRYSINALSFSHDGEYLAIANAGTYIDIVRQRQLAYLFPFNLHFCDSVPLKPAFLSIVFPHWPLPRR